MDRAARSPAVFWRGPSALNDDPQIGRAILENNQRVVVQGEPVAFEELADSPKGRRTFLSIKAPLRDPEGDVSRRSIRSTNQGYSIFYTTLKFYSAVLCLRFSTAELNESNARLD